jgi:hypothetical protein
MTIRQEIPIFSFFFCSTIQLAKEFFVAPKPYLGPFVFGLILFPTLMLI